MLQPFCRLQAAAVDRTLGLPCTCGPLLWFISLLFCVVPDAPQWSLGTVKSKSKENTQAATAWAGVTLSAAAGAAAPAAAPVGSSDFVVFEVAAPPSLCPRGVPAICSAPDGQQSLRLASS